MKQTQKSLLTAGVLAGVALLVAVLAALVRKEDIQKEEAKDKEEKLFVLDKAKVRKVRLEKAGVVVAAAAREADGKPWKLVQPVQADADDGAISALVDKLEGLKQKKDLGKEGDPKQLGLEPPRFKVAVSGDDGKEQALEIGADNPFDSTLYVRKAGEATVRIIDSFHKAAFEKTTFDLRDKRVARLDETAEIRGVSVTNEEPYTFTKDGANWKLTGPGHETAEPGDSGAVDRIIASLRSLRATGIAAETADAATLKRFDLDEHNQAVVELSVAPAGSKEPIRSVVTLGQPKPEKGQIAVKTYALRDGIGPVYEIESTLVRDLKKSWFDVQDKTVVRLDREQVRMLEIEAPGAAKIAVSRSKEAGKDGGVGEEKFAVVAPASGAAKRWKISSALFGLAGLKAAAFVGPSKDLAKFGLDKPLTYTALGEGGRVLARVQIGKPVPKNDKRLYARAQGGQIVEIEKGTADDLPKTLDDVLEAPPAAATDGGPVPGQANK